MGCWLCGRNGTADHLDRHHVFGGANRKKSERYGLVVYLCHNDCHIFGEQAAHRSRETAERLYRWGQAKAMRENGWTSPARSRLTGKASWHIRRRSRHE